MSIRSLEGGKLTPFSLFPVVNNIQNWTVPVGMSFFPEATTDDGHWSPSGVAYSYSSQYIYIGSYTGVHSYYSWIIFKNIIVPPGSIITAANIYLQPYSSKSGTTVNAKIYLNDTVTPTYPTGWADANSKVLTPSYVEWNNIGAWNPADGYSVSPDISTLIQYIIDKSGWTFSYNIMVFFIDNGSTSTANRDFKSWDNTGKYLPTLKLSVRYPTLDGWICNESISSSDDGWWTTGTFNNSNTDALVGLDTTSKHSFFRFPNIALAQGSVVDYAYLTKLTPVNGDTTNPVFSSKIYINDVDNAIAPADEAAADALTLSPGCDWDYINSWESPIQSINTYNIASLMNIPLNKSTWTLNNAIMLLLKDDSSSSYISFYTIENGEHNPMLLYRQTTSGCTAGYVWGGYNDSYHNDINKITYVTELQSLISAILPASISFATGVQSYVDGFNLGSNSTNIVYVLKFSTEVERTARDSMDNTRGASSGLSSDYKGYEVGGGNSTSIQAWIFAAEVSSTLSATLDNGVSYSVTFGNETKGYNCGGLGPTMAAADDINDLTYSTEASVILAATLAHYTYLAMGTSSTSTGYIYGGENPSIGTKYTDIQTLTFATESRSAIIETLDISISYGTGVDSTIKGYLCGGCPSSGGYTDAIRAFTYETETLVTLSEVLDSTKSRFSGVQNGGVF